MSTRLIDQLASKLNSPVSRQTLSGNRYQKPVTITSKLDFKILSVKASGSINNARVKSLGSIAILGNTKN